MQDYINCLDYSCIKKMNQSDMARFIKIVEEYAPLLNELVQGNGTVYTAHDFSHHCRNLYSIISDCILTDRSYDGEGGLTENEMYILNLSVLLHDIGMHEIGHIDRDHHAIKSAEIIKENYGNPSDALCEDKSALSKNDIDAICLIVKAHSNVKDDGLENPICALDDPKLTNSMPCRGNKHIRAHFLANILRLADELDITSERLAHTRAFKELERAEEKYTEACKGKNEEEKATYHKMMQSYRYWTRLNFFSEIKRDTSGIVWAIVNDEYLEEERDRGESADEINDTIILIREKIQKELAIFLKDINKEVAISNLIGIKEFCIKTDDRLLKQLLEKKQYHFENHIIENEIQVQLLEERISQQLSNFINSKKLISGGHYFRYDGLCARDWINVREITGTNSIFKKCESLLVSAMNVLVDTFRSEKLLFIGVDFSGMLIAAKAAMVLGKSFTYAEPIDSLDGKKTRKLVMTPDGDIDGVIIITDVIVTYHTIDEIVTKYNLKDKLLAIYGILYRRPVYNGDQTIETFSEYKKITYVLNKDYDIELRCNEGCSIKGQYGCIAANLPVK